MSRTFRRGRPAALTPPPIMMPPTPSPPRVRSNRSAIKLCCNARARAALPDRSELGLERNPASRPSIHPTKLTEITSKLCAFCEFHARDFSTHCSRGAPCGAFAWTTSYIPFTRQISLRKHAQYLPIRSGNSLCFFRMLRSKRTTLIFYARRDVAVIQIREERRRDVSVFFANAPQNFTDRFSPREYPT